MDEMILLVSDEIYPLSLSADNATVGANKDTAFLRRHISQIRAFSLFCTETQDPAARPPRVAALISAATATRGFTPLAAKSPVPKLQAGQTGPARCIARMFPSLRPLSGGRVGAPRAGQVSVLPQGWSNARGSSALGRRDMNPTPAEGGSCFGLCPIFKSPLKRESIQPRTRAVRSSRVRSVHNACSDA